MREGLCWLKPIRRLRHCLSSGDQPILAMNPLSNLYLLSRNCKRTATKMWLRLRSLSVFGGLSPPSWATDPSMTAANCKRSVRWCSRAHLYGDRTAPFWFKPARISSVFSLARLIWSRSGRAVALCRSWFCYYYAGTVWVSPAWSSFKSFCLYKRSSYMVAALTVLYPVLVFSLPSLVQR